MFDRKKYNKLGRIINEAEIYYKDNPERLRQSNKTNLEEAKEQYHRAYIKYNVEERKHRREWTAIKRKIDLKFNLNRKMSSTINYSLRGDKKGKHWEILVGYTLNDLIKRLKRTMPKDYTWQDYLQGKLHIDHIIPISAFNFTKAEHIDFKNCWALSNLRLLPAKENMIKHNKLSKSFQPALKISFIS